MLRHVLASSVLRKGAARLSQGVTATTRRSMLIAATSRQKRALDDQQLSGQAAAPSASAAVPTQPGRAPPPSGGSNAIPAVLALAVAGGGVAYYMDLIPDMGAIGGSAVASKEKEASAASDGKESGKTKETTASTTVSGNRVLVIETPKGTTRSDLPAPVKDHPEGGHRVLMHPSKGHAAGVDTALQELQKQLAERSSSSLSEAHQELAKLHSLDMGDIDNLTITQLKVRLVQMAKDLEERTKWEAVRLKEFLAMKEKETADEYLHIIKKQRVEYEDLMERRLRDQKEDLSRQSQAALQDKDAALQSVVDRYLKVQEQQFLEEKTEFEQKTEEQFSAKYEEMFSKSLSEAKEKFASKMEEKVSQLTELAQKLAELELGLKTSREFQSGSVQAHRMSAAALALVDRLETSKPAAAEVMTLQAVSGENSVVESALSSLPKSSLGGGIPTLQELQTRFEESVLPKSRQAAMVPAGQLGLEGQLLGMVFSTLKYAPGPEDPAPDTEKDAAEYVLARARRHVQLGELEQAVEQLDKVQGQVAFTVGDWKNLAKERVTVDKVLKVIRLECALANEAMGKAL